MSRAADVLDEIHRLLTRSELDTHVTWIWGGTAGDSVIVVYRWVRESTLTAYHRDVIEFGALFEPVDAAILAEVMAIEIEESGKIGVVVPDDIRAAVPPALRPGLVWAI